MNLLHSEIIDLIRVSREHPEMDVQYIFRQIVQDNNSELKYHSMINGFASLFAAESETLRPSCKDILRACCEIHNIFPDLVRSKSRKGELVRIRQQYCLVTYLFKHSFRLTGEEIGNRDHATAMNAKTKALSFYESEAEFREEVDIIINKFTIYSSTLMERLTALTEI